MRRLKRRTAEQREIIMLQTGDQAGNFHYDNTTSERGGGHAAGSRAFITSGAQALSA